MLIHFNFNPGVLHAFPGANISCDQHSADAVVRLADDLLEAQAKYLPKFRGHL